MRPLAELQREMASALLTGETGALAGLIAAGPIPAEAALAVHRDTVLGGLANALRLTFPTVDRLVGSDFFDQVCCAYAAQHPPREARLEAHATGFPAFLETYAPAAELAYLGDAARFDLAIQTAGAASREGEGATARLDVATRLILAPSLNILRVRYPVDAIRDALDAGDEDDLAGLDMTAAARAFAVWRGETGARVGPLSLASAAFLAALLTGSAAGEALERVLAADVSEGLSRLQAEVFGAGFATIHVDQTEIAQIGGDPP